MWVLWIVCIPLVLLLVFSAGVILGAAIKREAQADERQLQLWAEKKAQKL